MKKLLVFVLLIVITSKGFSQTGFKAGLNLSTIVYGKDVLWYDYQTVPSYKVGYYAGAFTNFKINEKLALQPELLFSMKGSNLEGNPAFNHANSKLNLYYFNLPLLISYTPVPGLALVAGPEVGILLKAISKVDGQHSSNLQESNRLDLGGSFGVNYIVLPAVAVELKYTRGFTFVGEHKRATNRSFQFGFAYHFEKD